MRSSSLGAFAIGCSILTLAATASAVDNSPARKAFIKSQLDLANASIDPVIREEKYTAMEDPAFAFFRGTDHLYFTDIQNGVVAFPGTWASTPDIRTWIQGDLHPQNVGYFGTKDGVVVLDLNDFDEAYLAPFYYDLVRFVAGIHSDEAGRLLQLLPDGGGRRLLQHVLDRVPVRPHRGEWQQHRDDHSAFERELERVHQDQGRLIGECDQRRSAQQVHGEGRRNSHLRLHEPDLARR